MHGKEIALFFRKIARILAIVSDVRYLWKTGQWWSYIFSVLSNIN